MKFIYLIGLFGYMYIYLNVNKQEKRVNKQTVISIYQSTYQLIISNIIQYTMGYKMFEDWCNEINTYLDMLIRIILCYF